jgi:Secretion system C-terminal sorting domain
MKRKLLFLSVFCLFITTGAWAAKLFIPMDATGQTNHLKAYGVTFAAMQKGIKVDWLLNYKGGSFAMEADADITALCKQRGVSFIKMSDKQYSAILKEMAKPEFNGKVVLLEKVPKIAVYTPVNKEPWDDAVTLALTYAEIPFDKLYAEEVLAGDLDKYDWLHLHHEDFTGQYGKFWMSFRGTAWYEQDKKSMEAMAAKHGFKKVSQMQLAVVKKIRDFVADGGNMFAMCSATTTFDIALAADGVDICPEPFDGDAVDPNAQKKLDFSKSLAFKDFAVSLNEYEYANSNIDNTNYRWVTQSTDYFEILTPMAKLDQVPAMLCQNHTTSIKGFMGQSTAFRMQTLKPNVMVLGDLKSAASPIGDVVKVNEARYIHGEYGKGSWTFLGGHDPEAYRHMVNDAPTDLSKYPNSAGYRLILNNVLFPSAKKVNVPTVVINGTEQKNVAPTETPNLLLDKTVKIYPNPADNELIVSITSGKVESVVIMNIAGQEIINKTYSGAKVSVDLKDLTPGMYMVKVNGDYVGKIVKE